MKKVLITAASSSLAKPICEAFRKAGYDLVLHYNHHEPDIQNAKLVRADLNNQAELKKFTSEIKNFGPFDVVINNMGVTLQDDLKNLDFWEQNFRLNAIVTGLLLAQGQELVKSGGCFVNVSSAMGHERFGGAEDVAYSVAKAAVNSLTRTFAKVLAPNIRVNAVAPGYVDSAWNENRSEEARTKLAKDQLTEKLVTKEQVASLIMELVNNEGINGEIIYVDGGLTLKTI